MGQHNWNGLSRTSARCALSLLLAGWAALQPAPAPSQPPTPPPSAANVLQPPSAPAQTGDGVPQRPANYDFVADYAGLIQGPDLNRIGAAQRTAFEKHGVPIIVVTIPSLRAYQFSGPIEQFAAKVFNQWQIGTKNSPGGANKGMLLLVSVGDRKARIELGADYGQRINSQTDAVMNGRIIPAFRGGNFSGGILAGVEGLAMIAAGKTPASAPMPSAGSGAPAGFMQQVQQHIGGKQPTASPASPLSKNTALLVAGLGLLLMIASAFMPAGLQKPVFWLGLILLLLPFIFFVVLLAFAWLNGGGRRGGGGNGGWSGGSFSSGGGFSGGFSGGGGSTGSW